jgi:hypothetical protein
VIQLRRRRRRAVASCATSKSRGLEAETSSAKTNSSRRTENTTNAGSHGCHKPGSLIEAFYYPLSLLFSFLFPEVSFCRIFTLVIIREMKISSVVSSMVSKNWQRTIEERDDVWLIAVLIRIGRG